MTQPSAFSILVIDGDWEELRAADVTLRSINGSVKLEPVYATCGEGAVHLIVNGYVPDLIMTALGLTGPLQGIATIQAIWHTIGERIPAALVTNASLAGSIPPNIKIISSGSPYIRSWIRCLDLAKSAMEMPHLATAR